METEGANATPMRSSYSSEVLQLLSSDHPGLILVSSPLDGKNFLAWSRAVRRALGAKSKLGFITGACRKPTGDPELIEQWTRVDCMVASWLLNTMTKNISNAFIYAKSARTLWIDLEQRYGQHNGPLLYQLEREIASVSQVEKQRQVHLAEPHEGAAMHAVTYDKKKELNSFRRRGVVDKRNLKCVHCDRTDMTKVPASNYMVYRNGTDFTFSGTEHLTEDTWIIDSGATSHMCSNPNAFHNLHPSASISSIFLPDGSTKQVTQSGLVNLFGKLKLTDMFLHFVLI
ncbi:hypothetical protein Sango_0796000 [Sesamum angolense]|uniref:Retrotransposon Copia-like N-terminal domain-containing protein n=1 Tax=Sesamum angolense TaxID=2727404 RepID=A0AAE1X2U5_9LAMI|nr:hypothetical protein Sango_0796000 [Sesamum angolense]